MAALRTSENELRILVYDVDSSGQLTQRQSVIVNGLPGGVSDDILQVALTQVTDNRIVAALRHDDSTFSILVWQARQTVG